MRESVKKTIHRIYNNDRVLNQFGLINISLLRCRLEEAGFKRIPASKNLMKYCNEIFGHEMANGEVEFIIDKRSK